MRRSGEPAWSRKLLSGLAGAVVVTGLTAGAVSVAQAEPTTPTPAPSETAGPTTSVSPTTSASPTTSSSSTSSSSASTSASSTSAGASSSASSKTPATGTANTSATGGGDVLDQLAEEYAIGSGGGQLSNLLKTSLKLRSMGFKPTKQYYDEIQAAMQYRPNQNPLISALKDTIAYQQKIRAQMDILQQSQAQKNPNSAVMGAGQMPADSNPNQLGVSAPQGAQAPVSVAAVPVAPAAAAPPMIMPAETP